MTDKERMSKSHPNKPQWLKSNGPSSAIEAVPAWHESKTKGWTRPSNGFQKIWMHPGGF
jgi:hypothetical protein